MIAPAPYIQSTAFLLPLTALPDLNQAARQTLARPHTPTLPRDIPQQLVAGEELRPNSIKSDVQIAPTQAAPQPPEHYITSYDYICPKP